jgi:hypothetical protein
MERHPMTEIISLSQANENSENKVSNHEILIRIPKIAKMVKKADFRLQGLISR